MFYKTSMNALILVTTLSGFTGFTQQVAATETTHFQSSRQAIMGACGNRAQFGTNATSGDYGCAGDDVSIYCTENGDCVMDIETTDRRLPPSRGDSGEGDHASQAPSHGQTGGAPSGGNSGGTFGGTFSTQAPVVN